LSARVLVPSAVAAVLAASLALGARAEEPASDASPAWLGITMKATPGGAVEVGEIFPGSPADAELRKGDLVLRADGKLLHEPAELAGRVSELAPGATIELVVQRGGEERTVRLVLAEHPGLEALVRNQHIDKPAPELFGLVGVGGTAPPRLSALRGKVVVLEFYAGWCSACRALSPVLARWHERYKDRGLAVVGITSDEPRVAARVARQWRIPYPVASAAADLPYAAVALPTTFLIDKKGVVREVMIGGSGGGAAALEKQLARLLEARG
jgi:thiol-disulfide isomerase/thioredoxin